MIGNMLYSFSLLLSVAFICQSINDVCYVQAAEFDELSDSQKGAAMALLKQAMNEIKVDPLELIRKGMEKVKEEHEKMAMNGGPQPQLGSPAPMDQSILSSTSSTVESMSSVSANELESSTRPNEIESVETVPATNTPEVVSPTTIAIADARSVVGLVPESTTNDSLGPNSSHTVDEPAPISTVSSTNTMRVSPVVTVQPTQPSGPTTVVENSGEMRQSDQKGGVNDVIPKQEASAEPADVDYENVFIDESDPNNPKQVHVKNRTKSKFDDNGFSHQHKESIYSTSIGNNPNVFSKHSSSYSSSGSSNAFVNGKQVKPINWTYNSMKPFSSIPPIPKIASIPPLANMPTMPPMQYMPFGSMMAGTWPGYFNQNYEELSYPMQAQAYVGAYAGLPENFFGVPNNPHMSRRQAKKLAKKQERAARRALQHDYYN